MMLRTRIIKLFQVFRCCNLFILIIRFHKFIRQFLDRVVDDKFLCLLCLNWIYLWLLILVFIWFKTRLLSNKILRCTNIVNLRLVIHDHIKCEKQVGIQTWIFLISFFTEFINLSLQIFNHLFCIILVCYVLCFLIRADLILY